MKIKTSLSAYNEKELVLINKEDFYQNLIEEIGKDQVLRDEPLANHTSFKVGGPAYFVVLPKTVDEIVYTIKICKANDMPYYIIGKGSNLLVGDRGYDGTIIKLDREFSDLSIEPFSIEHDSHIVRAQAGISLEKMADIIARKGLAGFEFAAGIPGTLGGAVTMNAGAYGGEIKDCINSVIALDKECNIVTLEKDELELGYRTSVIQKEGYIVLEADFVFESGDTNEILDKITELNNRRTDKQPLEHPSAGSTFKRPEGYFAGKLIMDCGLQGFNIGGAQVSTKHCGFIINTGEATAKDIYELIQHIKDVVLDRYDVILEQEVKMLGNF